MATNLPPKPFVPKKMASSNPPNKSGGFMARGAEQEAPKPLVADEDFQRNPKPFGKFKAGNNDGLIKALIGNTKENDIDEAVSDAELNDVLQDATQKLPKAFKVNEAERVREEMAIARRSEYEEQARLFEAEQARLRAQLHSQTATTVQVVMTDAWKRAHKEVSKSLAKSAGLVTPKMVSDDPSKLEPFYRDHPALVEMSVADIYRVRNIVNDAKLESTEYQLEYAELYNREFVKILDDILKESTSGKTVEVDRRMEEIANNLTLVNTQLAILSEPPKKRGWLDNLLDRSAPDDSVEEWTKVLKHIIRDTDSKAHELKKLIEMVVQYIDSFDDLFKANRDNARQLELHIIAGRIIIEKATKEAADRESNAVDVFDKQNVIYYKDAVERFGRRILDLDQTILSLSHSAIQIRQMQIMARNRAEMMQRVQSQIMPNWKLYMANLSEKMKDSKAKTVSEAMQSKAFQNDTTLAEAASYQKRITEAFTI